MIVAMDVWRARGFDLLVWYAKTFGISDLDINETDWMAHWCKRHHNQLKYDPLRCVYVWNEGRQ